MSADENGQHRRMRASLAESERQREHDAAMTGLQEASMEDLASEKADLIEKVKQSDLAEPSKKTLIDNLVAGDWTLSNYDDEDLNEIRWELRIFEDFYLVLHPAAESVVEGRFRQYVYDTERPKAALETLDEQDKFQIKQIFRGIWSRIKRSDDGFQWEQVGKSRSESVVISDDSDSENGLLHKIG